MSANAGDLKKRYASYSNERLLEIRHNKNEYTPEAIEAVTEEIALRKIDNTQVKSFTEEQNKIADEQEALFQIGIITPLSFWEKILYFFAWFIGPIAASAFQLNYAEDFQLLKLKQSRSFKMAGFFGLLLTGFLSVYFNIHEALGLVMYSVMFLAFNELEKRFFKYSFSRE